jgi:hypothetical protein
VAHESTCLGEVAQGASCKREVGGGHTRGQTSVTSCGASPPPQYTAYADHNGRGSYSYVTPINDIYFTPAGRMRPRGSYEAANSRGPLTSESRRAARCRSISTTARV